MPSAAKPHTLTRLSDRQLVDELVAAHAGERSAGARVIAYLIEVDRRQLYGPAQK